MTEILSLDSISSGQNPCENAQKDIDNKSNKSQSDTTSNKDEEQEGKGRWTAEEHEAFIEALNLHGREVKKKSLFFKYDVQFFPIINILF